MNKILETPAFWPVIYLILVLGRGPIKEILKLIRESADSMKRESPNAADAIQKGNERMFKALKHVFDIVLDALNGVVDTLDSAIFNISQQFTTQRGILASRILGSVISFILLLAFLYTDAALGFQAMQTLFPGIKIPEFLRNIGVALVVSSIATIFSLSMMFGDLTGHTEFTTLSQMKKFWKGVFIGVVLLTGLFTLGCVLLIALNRAPVLAGLVDQAGFSPLIRAEIHRLASVAQSLVIIPVLVTTFLMFRGVFGVFVLFILILGAISFLVKVTRLLVRVLKAIMVPGVGDAFVPSFLFSLFQIVILCLGWIIGGVLALAAVFTQALQHLLDVITLPTIKIWEFVVPIVRTLLGRNTRPPAAPGRPADEPNYPQAPANQPIPELLDRLRNNGKGQHSFE